MAPFPPTRHRALVWVRGLRRLYCLVNVCALPLTCSRPTTAESRPSHPQPHPGDVVLCTLVTSFTQEMSDTVQAHTRRWMPTPSAQTPKSSLAWACAQVDPQPISWRLSGASKAASPPHQLPKATPALPHATHQQGSGATAGSGPDAPGLAGQPPPGLCCPHACMR